MSADPAPLRLALCITDLLAGGAERMLVELATRIDRRRFVPVVYSLAPCPRGDPRSLVPLLEAGQVEVHSLGARRPRQALAAVARLARMLDAQRAELLQSFLFHANIVGRLAARRARVPRVLSGIRVAERRGGWRLKLDRWTSRYVDLHVAVSESVARFSSTCGGLPAQRIVVIPNGVDLEQFNGVPASDLSDLGLASGRRAVTFVGRLDPQKGLSRFIDHAHGWLDRLPQHDLLLVGEGPERASLETLARQHQIDQRVHFAGWRGDVPRILAASDLVVLPSQWEGMPNSILEAMAARRPVVATDAEGVLELLGPHAGHQVVPVGDAQAFAAQIVTVLSQPCMAARLGQANRERVAQHFSIQRMVHRYEELFWQLARPLDFPFRDFFLTT